MEAKSTCLGYAHTQKTDAFTKQKSNIPVDAEKFELSIDLTMTAQGAFFPKENFKEFLDTECKSSIFVMIIYYDAGRSK